MNAATNAAKATPNYIYEYYQGIVSGDIAVSKWIRAWYELVIHRIEDGSYTYSAREVKKVTIFAENFCRHHEGALAPQRVKLELWQKSFLSVVFGILDKDGNRQFREVVLEVGRKNGKTLLAAIIANYMMFCDDEYGARIYFAAPKLEQANLCYEATYQMIKKEPALDSITKKRRTDLYVESSNSSAKPIAFNAKKSDGLNISCCIGDEIASWHGDNGLKFYEVIKSSFGARKQPLLLSISTAGYENDGIFDELIKRCTAVLKGSSQEERLAPFLYVIDDPAKWDDINELRKSNPNLGVSISVDYLIEEINIARGSLSKKTEFLVKYCNIKQNSSQAWLDRQDVEKAMGDHIGLEDFRECYAVAGIDLSQTTDLTAAVIAIEKEGKLNVLAKFWLPGEKIEEAIERDGLPYYAYIERGILQLSGENFIDYHDVEQWMIDLVEKYEIYPLKVGYDRYSAQYLVQDLSSYGFHMDDVYQGDNLYPIWCEIEGLIKDGKINIGDNDLLAIHLLNSALKMSIERGRGRLVKINPKDHIDGTAAFGDAMTVRSKYFAEIGDQLTNKD